MVALFIHQFARLINHKFKKEELLISLLAMSS